MMCTLPAIVLGIFRMIVVPVQYQDTEIQCTRDSLESAVSTLERYFNDQFQPERTIKFDIAETVTLSGNLSYYGSNSSDRKDGHLREAVVEACSAIRASTDFSLYDNDQDGAVDNLILFSAGLSEADGAGEEFIWPQHAHLENIGGIIYAGGRRIDAFTVCTELKSEAGENARVSGTGTLAHEISHGFGLMDMYDSDGELSGGLSKGLGGSTSLMDRGLLNDDGHTPPYYNAIERDQLGLGTCDTLSEGRFRLSPIGSSNRYMKCLTKNPGVCYLLECRAEQGWDSHIGGNGMLIYRVDRSQSDAGYSDYYKVELTAADRWLKNEVNCNPDHQCAMLVETNPESDDISGAFFPQEKRSSVTVHNFAITDIVRDGDDITFEATEHVRDEESVCFQDAAILKWTVAGRIAVKGCSVSWKSENEDEPEGVIDVSPAADGQYNVTIEGLRPRTYYDAEIRMVTTDSLRISRRMRFRTKNMIEGVIPFIYLNTAERGPGGTFLKGTRVPLRIYNAIDLVETRWTFNGKEISTGSDGYYHIESEGLLVAELTYTDGSMDRIEKQISL